jgi:TonB-linked SusC/RagA family outer membrane protein
MYKIYTNKLGMPPGIYHKILLIMRLTTVLLIASILQVSASTYGQKITLSEKNAPLTKVFSKIRSQSGYDFLFTRSILKDAKAVDIDVENADLNQVLGRIFEGQPLSYIIEDKSVIISRKIVFSNQVIQLARPITVQGYVKNEKGEPLAGANIMLMGSNYGYGALDDGYYIFENIDENSSFIVSYVGYKTDTIKVRGRRQLNITMKLYTETVAEVAIISTGYQTIAKERATGAYAKPDMQTFRNRSASLDIMSRLDGLVAGLTVISGPAGTGGSMYQNGGNQQSVLRGKSSVLVQSEPLYVVDGVQTPNFSSINPNDVEDITVLKDAAAAAIYGAKAANGVIVVVTKKGKKNEAIKINYSGSINFQGKPNFREGLYMNSAQYIHTAKEIFDPVTYPWSSLSRDLIAPHDLVLYNQYRGLISDAQASKSLDSLSGIDNRQQIKDLFYRNAFTTNHTVSASGGFNNYSFYTSASYSKTQSNTTGQQNDAYRVSFNQTITPANWISISLSTSLNNNLDKTKNPISIQDTYYPYQLFRDANGNNIQMNYSQGLSPEVRADFQARSRLDLNYTPLDEFEKQYSSRNMMNFSNTANVDAKLFKGLSFNGTYGYQKSPGTSGFYSDISEYNMRRELLNFTKASTPADEPVYYLPTTGGRFISSDYLSQNWTVRNQLVYNAALRGERDHLNIQIGQEALESTNRLSRSTLRGYDDVLKTYALLDYVTLAKPLFGAIGSGYSSFYELPYELTTLKSRFASYFGLFNYSFNGKYILDGSLRTDKSSLFATDQSGQKKPTYSIGGKWNISKETFMAPVSWLNDLGLRVTYGVTGNSPYIGASSIVDILYAGTNSNTGNYLSLQNTANKKLSWESTHTINAAVDFAVLNSRLSGSIDLYSKNTTDLLGSVKYNPLTGNESATGNIGNIRNKGIELALRSDNIRGPGFNWSSSLILSYNKNKLVSYSVPEQYQQTADAWIYGAYQIGYSNPSLFAYRFAGLDNMGDPQIKLADGTITKERDKASTGDLVYMGTTLPKFNGGLGNTFRYKGISLAANISYSLGAVMRNYVNSFYSGRLAASAGSFNGGNVMSTFADRWKKPGDEAFTNIPSYISNQGDSYTRRNLDYFNYGDVNVISASYVKLRDITLSYDFSSGILRSLNVDHINVYVQGTNYMLWKANKADVDPEYTSLSKGGRSYSLGLNVTF